MDQELSKKVCRLVAGLVVADDDLDPEEDAFVDRMMARFGLPAEERGSLFPIVDKDEAAEAMRGLPAAVREEAMALLIDAACADGKLVDEERAYLHAVGDAVGLERAELDRRVASRLAAGS